MSLRPIQQLDCESRFTRTNHLQDTRMGQSQHRSQWQKKKGPGACRPCVHKSHRACLSQGRSALCPEDTSERSPTQVVISGGKLCFPLGDQKTCEGKGSQYSHVTLSGFRHPGPRFIKKENGSQYGPYFPCNVRRLSSLAHLSHFGDAHVRPLCLPKRPLQHLFRSNHLEEFTQTVCSLEKGSKRNDGGQGLIGGAQTRIHLTCWTYADKKGAAIETQQKTQLC